MQLTYKTVFLHTKKWHVKIQWKKNPLSLMLTSIIIIIIKSTPNQVCAESKWKKIL